MTDERTLQLRLDAAARAARPQPYFPQPAVKRKGIALCLSGGGYRAAMFHLGALRRMNELGALGLVDTVSAVSGGSLLAAHLARSIKEWPAPGTVLPAFDAAVATGFHEFVKMDIRTGPLAQRLLPWNWGRRGTQVDALTRLLRRHLTADMLAALPERPRFIFCASDMVFGANWTYARDKMGDWLAGSVATPPDFPVATAVGASCCFPPFFGPMKVGQPPTAYSNGRYPAGPERDRLLGALRLTDGGLYDNMGLEPVWETHQAVLVSDGGSPFDFDAGGRGLGLLLRYVTIVGHQAASVRKRWLISNMSTGVLSGAYWGIGSATGRYDATRTDGYAKTLAKGVIARIRTDLDGFNAPERAVLENHGYLLADAAIRTHVTDFVRIDAPLRVPHPEWMDAGRVEAALADSSKRFTWKRLWSRVTGKSD